MTGKNDNGAKSDGGVTIVYDGQCPFCSSYVELVSLREQFGRVELVDARSSAEWQQRLAEEGLDINEGFAVEHRGSIHSGSDALAFIANSSRSDQFSSRINAFLFSSRKVARIAYPLLRAGRNLSLALLGRQKI